MNKETLMLLAEKLMFTMDDSEYETLNDEFITIIKQMDLIGEIKDIDSVEPLIYPIEIERTYMREDSVQEELEIDDIMKNGSSTLYNQIKLPKVVE